MQKKKSAAVGFFVLSMFVLVLLLVPQPVLAGHRVIKSVTVSTDNDNWGGPCPKEIRFTGVIQVNPLPGALVNYHWERSDGARTQPKVVTINPGQHELVVENNWTLGTSGFKARIWQILVAESGNQHIKRRSKTIPIKCQ